MNERTMLFLSGPNLNLLGTREPAIYGTETLDDLIGRARRVAGVRDLLIEHIQSNSESELIGAIHSARSVYPAIVINPGAFTHYAWGIADALASYEGHVIELHISNPRGREAWRHTSVVSPVADGVIAGFGGLGYDLAVEAVARHLEEVGE